jgi:hypothetical protein
MAEDSAFEKDLIVYLDSCRVGEFLTGTMEEVSSEIPMTKEPTKDMGIHTIMVDSGNDEIDPEYQDPMQTLPEPPPGVVCDKGDDCKCDNCSDLHAWYERFQKVVDDIIFRSNIHKCFGRRDNAAPTDADSPEEPRKGRNIPRMHATGKGCINKDGVCTARFPRETFLATMVDVQTGHINLRKKEKWLNNITPIITATNRCNTDTTCLLSGTAVKAILGYITDYITKGWLKTHQVFSTMYETFDRKPLENDPEDGSKPGNGARRMVMRIVNSLSSKSEIRAPMAALYLLGNPDRYCSHEFRFFYWKNYLNFVEDEWKSYLGAADPDDLPVPYEDPESEDVTDIGVTRTEQTSELARTMIEHDRDEVVRVARSKESFVGKTTTDDYRWRPIEHEKLNLYEWIQCSVKQYEQSNRLGRLDLQFYRYHPEHPLHKSHLVACDLERCKYVVPNFVGPPLPRKDSGDKEQYCQTILVLFHPWRTGIDLKSISKMAAC